MDTILENADVALIDYVWGFMYGVPILKTKNAFYKDFNTSPRLSANTITIPKYIHNP